MLGERDSEMAIFVEDREMVRVNSCLGSRATADCTAPDRLAHFTVYPSL